MRRAIPSTDDWTDSQPRVVATENIRRIRTFIAAIDETQRHIELARSHAHPLGGLSNTTLDSEGLVVLNPGTIGQIFACFSYDSSIEWLRGDGELWSPNDHRRFSDFRERYLCSDTAVESSFPGKKRHIGETLLNHQQDQQDMNNCVSRYHASGRPQRPAMRHDNIGVPLQGLQPFSAEQAQHANLFHQDQVRPNGLHNSQKNAQQNLPVQYMQHPQQAEMLLSTGQVKRPYPQSARSPSTPATPNASPSHPVSSPNVPTSSVLQERPHFHMSPFFAQSSSHFVAPLQSSYLFCEPKPSSLSVFLPSIEPPGRTPETDGTAAIRSFSHLAFSDPNTHSPTPVPQIGEMPELQPPHLPVHHSIPERSRSSLAIQRRGSTNIKAGNQTPYLHTRINQPQQSQSVKVEMQAMRPQANIPAQFRLQGIENPPPDAQEILQAQQMQHAQQHIQHAQQTEMLQSTGQAETQQSHSAMQFPTDFQRQELSPKTFVHHPGPSMTIFNSGRLVDGQRTLRLPQPQSMASQSVPQLRSQAQQPVGQQSDGTMSATTAKGPRVIPNPYARQQQQHQFVTQNLQQQAQRNWQGTQAPKAPTFMPFEGSQSSLARITGVSSSSGDPAPKDSMTSPQEAAGSQVYQSGKFTWFMTRHLHTIMSNGDIEGKATSKVSDPPIIGPIYHASSSTARPESRRRRPTRSSLLTAGDPRPESSTAEVKPARKRRAVHCPVRESPEDTDPDVAKPPSISPFSWQLHQTAQRRAQFQAQGLGNSQAKFQQTLEGSTKAEHHPIPNRSRLQSPKAHELAGQ